MMLPRDMVCLRNISIDTLHKGDTEDDDDDDDDNNNNNNRFLSEHGNDALDRKRGILWLTEGL